VLVATPAALFACMSSASADSDIIKVVLFFDKATKNCCYPYPEKVIAP
jgi:hypothetical protein